MPGAAAGSSAFWPSRVCPLVTVSRLVPSWLISFSSAAEEEAARLRTATIAATPIAMPSADSAARSLRVRSPTVARAAGWWRSWLSFRGADGNGGGGGAGVGDDAAIEHLDAAPGAGGDGVVVG